ncbi:hypothetical protein SOVF_083470 isoform A, partial [Spinacia oleracea]
KSSSRSQVLSNAHFQIQVSSNSRFQFSGLNRRLHRGVDRDLSNSRASNCRNAACGLFTGLTRVRRFQQVPFNYSATLWC